MRAHNVSVQFFSVVSFTYLVRVNWLRNFKSNNEKKNKKKKPEHIRMCRSRLTIHSFYWSRRKRKSDSGRSSNGDQNQKFCCLRHWCRSLGTRKWARSKKNRSKRVSKWELCIPPIANKPFVFFCSATHQEHLHASRRTTSYRMMRFKKRKKKLHFAAVVIWKIIAICEESGLFDSPWTWAMTWSPIFSN